MDKKNWKTTVAGILAFTPQIIAGLQLFPIPAPVLQLITGVFGVLALYFAKDKNVTGGTVNQ